MHVHALGHLSSQRAPFSADSGRRDEILTPLSDSLSNLCGLYSLCYILRCCTIDEFVRARERRPAGNADGTFE